MAMNLIDIAEELEFVPKADLAAMIDNPNSRYPSFMVLSEIQRRTKMEKMFETARMQTPQTTVAEEAVMEMTGIGAMPMQAGMSSPVNSQGSGLQGMAPPTLTAQTGLFTSQEQLIARLKRLAEQGDINAQRDLQQLTQRLGGISDFVFDETKVDLSATMPQNFTVENLPQKQRDILSQTFEGFPQLGLTTEEQRDKFRGFTREELRENTPITLRDVTAFGLEEVRAVKERKAQEKGLADLINRMQEDMTTLNTQSVGLGGDQAKIGNQSTNDVEVDTRRTLDRALELVKKQDTTSAPIETSGLKSFNLEQGMQEIEDAFSTKPKAPLEERVSGITERFGLKSIDIPKITEEDRQRELSVFTLGNLAKAIGSAKNLGEIASGLGESAIGLQGLKRRQRREDIADRLAQTKADRELLSTALNIAGKEDVQDTALQAQKQAEFNARSALRREALEIDKYNNMVKRQASADELAKEQGRLLRISTAATIAKVDLLEDQLNESQKKNLIDTLQQLNKSYEQAIDVTEKQNIFNRIISISDELNKRLGIDNIPAATGAVANQITN